MSQPHGESPAARPRAAGWWVDLGPSPMLPFPRPARRGFAPIRRTEDRCRSTFAGTLKRGSLDQSYRRGNRLSIGVAQLCHFHVYCKNPSLLGTCEVPIRRLRLVGVRGSCDAPAPPGREPAARRSEPVRHDRLGRVPGGVSDRHHAVLMLVGRSYAPPTDREGPHGDGSRSRGRQAHYLAAFLGPAIRRRLQPEYQRLG